MDQTLTNPAGTLAAPLPFRQTLTGRGVLAIAASLFVAASAHLSVPLPFTPVPLTFSDLAVLLVGLALGPGTAFAALVLYLAEGATGLPVFSPAGPGGLLQLFGVTGGFLLSYPAAAALTSFLKRHLTRLTTNPFAVALVAAAAGSTLLMLCGTLWFGTLLHLPPAATLAKATTPFLPGQLIKSIAAAGIITSAQRLRRA